MNFIGIISEDGEKSCIKGNYVPNSQISIHTQIFEESAFIDGCSRYQIFFKMILPLSKPGLSTLVIYSGVNIWNEFSFAYTLTQSAENRTLPFFGRLGISGSVFHEYTDDSVKVNSMRFSSAGSR